MNAIEKLKSVLCSPDGEVCIHGSEEDRRIVAKALSELQSAPIVQKAPAGIWMREFIDAVEREAFKIRAPNTHTPVLIGMCNEARRKLFAAAQAKEGK